MTAADVSGGQEPFQPNSPPSKASLSNWWDRFRKKGAGGEKDEPQGIFGVPLQQSICYANVAISLTDANGESQVYGYVPIVVAKCGVFLKEKATDVEGIFRLSGSAKRIKDLQTLFNTPDKYGKGLDWTGYTVHDAANVLRRYLNQLPEPIIPLDFYNRFRDPLTGPPDSLNVGEAIKTYQKLISELPSLNRQLLLYILDLLAVFASKSDHNLMTATNLAAIFQPGLISHPSHEMAPQAYKLSQDVLVFLITHQDHFLIHSMRGNSASAEKPIPSTPSSLKHSKSMVVRTPSTSSAGAEDVRKYGGVRRNASVKSKHSTGGSPAPISTGINRSNTLPSRRSPRAPLTTNFRPVDGASSSALTSANRAPSPSGKMMENMTPVEKPTSIDLHGLGMRPIAESQPGPRQPSSSSNLERPKETSPVTTPIREKHFVATIFARTPEERPGRKLQKTRRIPGSRNHSADSSTTSLPATSPTVTPGLDAVPASLPPLPMDPRARPISPPPTSHPAQSTGPTSNPSSSQNLLPTMSPTPSATSSVTSQDSMRSFSDTTTNTSTSPEKKKSRSRWKRFSTSRLDYDPPLSPTFGASNGSIAERIRQASRSPPPTSRGALSESSGDDDSRERKGFFRLPKGLKSRKKEDREFESVPPISTQQTPRTPIVQPPTPVAPPNRISPIKEASHESSSVMTTPRQSAAIPEELKISSGGDVPAEGSLQEQSAPFQETPEYFPENPPAAHWNSHLSNGAAVGPVEGEPLPGTAR